MYRRCRKKPIFGVEVNSYWDNIIFALIGQVLEDNDEICGCRVVEKSKPLKQGQQGIVSPHFRIELWLRKNDVDLIDRMKDRLPDILIVDSGKNKLAVSDYEVKHHEM